MRVVAHNIDVPVGCPVRWEDVDVGTVVDVKNGDAIVALNDTPQARDLARLLRQGTGAAGIFSTESPRPKGGT